MEKPAQRAFALVLNLFQVAFAILVVYITSARLLNVQAETKTSLYSYCLLGDPANDSASDKLAGSRLCIYAIAVGVIACIATLIVCCLRNLVKCATCDICGASRIVDIIADAALFLWWLIAFIIFVRRGTAANDAGVPRATERNAVIGIAFGAMLSFALDIAVTIWTMVS